MYSLRNKRCSHTHTDTLCASLLAVLQCCVIFFSSLEWTLLSLVRIVKCRLQTTVSPLLLSQKKMVWAKLACSLHIPLPILVTLLEQTAAPCDPNKLTVWLKSEYKASKANHSHSQHGIVLSSPLYRLTNLASKHCAVNCLLLFSVSSFVALPPSLGPRASGRCTRLGCWCCFTWCSPPGSTACALVPTTCLSQSFWLRRSLQSGLLFFCLQLK